MRAASAVAAVALVLASCAPDTRSPTDLETGTGPVAALAPLPAGGLRFAELRTGRVRELSSRGILHPAPVAEVEVSNQGQRGLLGLAVDGRGRTFAAWTQPDGMIVAGQVHPGTTRLVWRGPMSADIANGGHIAFRRDGSLLIGIGDLTRPELRDDSAAPNGKILRLDPDGPESQQPELVSSGWNNPFAFAVTPSGTVWVADNAPGERPEVLADADRRAVVELPRKTVPSGLTAAADDLLVLCAYRTRVVQPYRIVNGRPGVEGAPLTRDCRYAVTLLSDGRVAYAAPDAIRTVRL